MAGTVITFYSYKGGVGRSFALANIAALLSEWGFRVLAIDWDIEAPGLHHYFKKYHTPSKCGVIEFLKDCKHNRNVSWDDYADMIAVPGASDRLFLMPAVKDENADYAKFVQTLNWDELYSKYDFGEKLEHLRMSWVEQFDFILIDNRTGVTDFSGTLTAQLPDILAFFFTANNQSFEGSCDVAKRAMQARRALPIDRPAIIPLPIFLALSRGKNMIELNTGGSILLMVYTTFFKTGFRHL